MNSSTWPQLEYKTWKETYETIHRWTQIIGKVRLCNDPWTNHSWGSTLYVTARGLGTHAVSNGTKNFSTEFDFVNHRLILQSSDGREVAFLLRSETVASFYSQVTTALKELGIKSSFYPYPNELPDLKAFADDNEHKTYEREHAKNFWNALVIINNVFKQFRSLFLGKCSPVHFFWGSFDLAVTRFSGRRAPTHPGGIPHLPDDITREAYSHEVSSAGFWPGNEAYPHAAFYSYAYPIPKGLAFSQPRPHEAFFNKELNEFILNYRDVRDATDPENMLMSFLQSTYELAADLGHWDRDLLEVSPYLKGCQDKYSAT